MIGQPSLPTPVASELLSVAFRNSDMSIDYICDELHYKGFVPGRIYDYDHAIHIEFAGHDLEGLLIVDRIRGDFELTTKGSTVTLPLRGDWPAITDRLAILQRAA